MKKADRYLVKSLLADGRIHCVFQAIRKTPAPQSNPDLMLAPLPALVHLSPLLAAVFE